MRWVGDGECLGSGEREGYAPSGAPEWVVCCGSRLSRTRRHLVTAGARTPQGHRARGAPLQRARRLPGGACSHRAGEGGMGLVMAMGLVIERGAGSARGAPQISDRPLVRTAGPHCGESWHCRANLEGGALDRVFSVDTPRTLLSPFNTQTHTCPQSSNPSPRLSESMLTLLHMHKRLIRLSHLS